MVVEEEVEEEEAVEEEEEKTPETAGEKRTRASGHVDEEDGARQHYALFVSAAAKVDGGQQQVGIGNVAIGEPDQPVRNSFGINEPSLRVERR